MWCINCILHLVWCSIFYLCMVYSDATSGSSNIVDGAMLESFIDNLVYGEIPVFLKADVEYSRERALR